MSNRSLFEFNHDFFDRLRDDPQGFMDQLQNYLRSGDPDEAQKLRRYGLVWFGMKHHSDAPWKWGTER